MKGAIAKAEELAASTPNAFMPMQFDNGESRSTTGTTTEEIWRDTEGKVDIVVAGVGTGGTITGLAEASRPGSRASSRSQSGRPTRPSLSGGQAGPHKIRASAPASSPRSSTGAR